LRRAGEFAQTFFAREWLSSIDRINEQAVGGKRFLSMKNHANLIREFIDDVLNHGDIRGYRRIFSRRGRRAGSFPGQRPGLNGLKDVLRRFQAAFPDMHRSVKEQIEEGDKVVSRFVWTGTHRAEFLGVPATAAECPFGG
jgi:hypothetical protein